MKPPLMTAANLAISSAFPAQWRSALKPRGKPGPPMLLAEKGQARCIILLPAKPSTQEQKAAEELGQWLQVMTGAAFPIMWEAPESTGQGGGVPDMLAGKGAKRRRGLSVLSIGNTELWRRTRPALALDDLGAEGYAIARHGGTLFLTGGRRRGPIYAVYALLEEDLDCRWFDSRSAVIPSQPRLAFRPVCRSFVPALELRDPFNRDAFDADWSLRNRTNAIEARVPKAWGGYASAPPGWFVHTYNQLVPPDIFFKRHPEYFSEIKGKRQPFQLCLTHPEVLTISIARVRDVLLRYPEARQISVSPNDRQDYCECAACRAVAKVEGTPSGALIRFVNAVADAIRKEFPRVRITTLAYLGTLAPPRTIRPRDNVIIYLCTDRHAWAWPFLPACETRQFSQALKAWTKIGARVYIWDYTVNFSHFCLPMPNLPVVTENIRFLCQNGAKGIVLQGAYQCPGGENALLRNWVWSKLLWNPALDTQALMRDFIFGYFGRAAGPIWKYNDGLWRFWQRTHRNPKTTPFKNGAIYEIRFAPDAPFLSPAFMREAFQLFEHAERLADSEEIRRRVSLAKLPILYTRLAQEIGVMNRNRRFWMGARSRLKAYFQGKSLKNNLAPVVDELETIVRREHVTYFREIINNMLDFPNMKLDSPTDAEVCIGTWRDLSGDLPSFAAHMLANRWKFQTDPQERGVGECWFAPEALDSRWANLQSDLDPGQGNVGWEVVKGYETYMGVAWYRQWFELPAGFDRRKFLRMAFLVVKREAEIWINGQKAFEQTCATTGFRPNEIGVNEIPFQFDVRPYLKPRGKNLLAVRVKAWSDARDNRCGICKPAALVSSDRELTLNMLTVLVQAARQRK